MISCVEFIPAYSEMFTFLEKKGGVQAVQEYWDYFADHLMGSVDLKEMVEKHGLKGCWIYWNHTLNEEACDLYMEYDDQAQEFRIDMYRCPSKGQLIDYPHVEPYHNYCGHCSSIYARILEPLGYECITDHSEVDKARCVCVIKPKQNVTVQAL